MSNEFKPCPMCRCEGSYKTTYKDLTEDLRADFRECGICDFACLVEHWNNIPRHDIPAELLAILPEFDHEKYEYEYDRVLNPRAPEEFWNYRYKTWERNMTEATHMAEMIIRRPRAHEWKVGDGFMEGGVLYQIINGTGPDTCYDIMDMEMHRVEDGIHSFSDLKKSLTRIPHAELLQLAVERAKEQD